MDTRGVVRTADAHTTLAFVSIDARGEREFSFLRRHGADVLIEKDEVDLSIMKDARMLQYGSLSFTGQPARDTSAYIIEAAKERGVKICYDPNYRPMLWESEAEAVEQMRRALSFADIVKMSENEMALLLNVSSDAFSKGANKLLEAGVEVALITAGREGAYFATREDEGFVPGFSVRAVDTTGCGDAFTGAFEYMMLNRPKSAMREKVRFANAVGALCATKMGGMPAMPSLDEAKAFLAAQD